ncbi:MAG: Na+/H+ antiporter [Gammaproteobacteria bacterium]|nr:Na+/H+ antiporter [Gammaproteobacteria bacterium]
MNFIEASVFIMFIAIISVPLANRLRLPLEIFLVLGSCMVSLMPGLPAVEVNPVIVFNIFLPPILFSAALATSWRDFKLNITPISLLAFGLVIFTTVSVAILIKLLLPGFSWSEGFLLGAIVSPTDASAATTILRKLGAPRKFVAILEGESLVNDATALTLYRFSLAAIMSESFSITHAVSQFFIVAIGGLVVGLLIGYLAALGLRKLKDVQAETTFTIITAFTSYFVAEHLGFSGVISTVVAGLYFGLKAPEYIPTHTRLNSKASWSTLMFIINGFVFTLIGLQLPSVLKNLVSYSGISLIFYGSVMSLAVILLRVIWVYLVGNLSQFFFPKAYQNVKLPGQFFFALGWTGMRGIISLAAVLAIPEPIVSGVSDPHKDLMIFLTYCVIVATLIVPTLTLPSLLRILNLTEGHDKIKDEARIRVRMLRNVLKSLAALKEKEKIPLDTYNAFHGQVSRRIKIIKTHLNETPYSTLENDYFTFKKLTFIALEAEKEALIRLRNSGEMHDDVFRALLGELDIEEMRARSMRI